MKTATNSEHHKLARPAHPLSVEMSDWTRGWAAQCPQARCIHLVGGAGSAGQTIPHISVFGVPLRTGKKYSKFMASNATCPGQSSDGHSLLASHYTSLLSNWYVLYCSAFNQDSRTWEAACGFRWQGPSLLWSTVWSSHSLTLRRKAKSFLSFLRSDGHPSLGLQGLTWGPANIPHYQSNAVF